jgi:hypothetical protein
MQTRVIVHALLMSGIAAGSVLASAVSSRATESSAVAFVAQFDQGAYSTGIAGVAAASGHGPQAYRSISKLNSFHQPLLIQPGRLPLPEMTANLSKVVDTATSPGIGVDRLSSDGDSVIGSASVTLTGYQCPACVQPVIDYLSLQAATISASAQFAFTAPSFLIFKGSTTLGPVRLTGQLVGDKAISYPGGSPAPNFILYKDGATVAKSTVVIMLNRQQQAGTVSFCGGGPASSCPFNPSNIMTTAIDIRLHGAMIAGTPVTGNIEIGRTKAE